MGLGSGNHDPDCDWDYRAYDPAWSGEGLQLCILLWWGAYWASYGESVGMFLHSLFRDRKNG